MDSDIVVLSGFISNMAMRIIYSVIASATIYWASTMLQALLKVPGIAINIA